MRTVFRGATRRRCDPNGNQFLAPLVQQNSILAVPATNVRVRPVACFSVKLSSKRGGLRLCGKNAEKYPSEKRPK
jgi:hypothetical protein